MLLESQVSIHASHFFANFLSRQRFNRFCVLFDARIILCPSAQMAKHDAGMVIIRSCTKRILDPLAVFTVSDKTRNFQNSQMAGNAWLRYAECGGKFTYAHFFILEHLQDPQTILIRQRLEYLDKFSHGDLMILITI